MNFASGTAWSIKWRPSKNTSRSAHGTPKRCNENPSHSGAANVVFALDGHRVTIGHSAVVGPLRHRAIVAARSYQGADHRDGEAIQRTRLGLQPAKPQRPVRFQI